MGEKYCTHNAEFKKWQITADPAYLVWAYFDDGSISSDLIMLVDQFWQKILPLVKRHPIHFSVFRIDMSQDIKAKYSDFESFFHDVLKNPTILLNTIFFGTTLTEEDDYIGKWPDIIRYQNWREMKKAILRIKV